jgi:hypothetical protein
MRTWIRYGLAACLIAGGVAPVFAQGRPGGQGGPGCMRGQGGPGGGFRQFREQHKNAFRLQAMMSRGLMDVERNAATQIKPAQAKKMLAVLNPLRKQSKLTEPQAAVASKRIQGILDTRQRSLVLKAAQEGPGGGRRGGPDGRMRGPGGGMRGTGGLGGSGRPGGDNLRGSGGGRPGGPGPRFDPARMRNFNPVHTPADAPPFMRDRTNRLFTFLQARAAGKSAKLDLGGPGGFRGRGGPGGGRPGNMRRTQAGAPR